MGDGEFFFGGGHGQKHEEFLALPKTNSKFAPEDRPC